MSKRKERLQKAVLINDKLSKKKRINKFNNEIVILMT